MKKKQKILGEYLGHLFMGAMMFLALLAFGGAISALVHWTAPIFGDPTFTGLMKFVEKIILLADMLFIVWWAIYSTFKAIKEMCDD